MDGWMDGWMYGWMDEWMDGCMNGLAGVCLRASVNLCTHIFIQFSIS